MMKCRYHREVEISICSFVALFRERDDMAHKVETKGWLSTLKLYCQCRRWRFECALHGKRGIFMAHVETAGCDISARYLTVLTAVIAAERDDKDVKRRAFEREGFSSVVSSLFEWRPCKPSMAM